MNEVINIVSVIIHITTMLVIWKVWHWRSFAHPGFFFAVLWLVSVISEWYMIIIDYASLPFPEYIDELNVYTAFTSLCFLVVSLIGSEYSKYPIIIDVITNKRNYILLMCCSLFSAMVQFMLAGATLSFGSNRINTTDGLMHINRQATIWDSILSIMMSPLTFLSLTMGMSLAQFITKQRPIFKNYLLIAMPFLITLIIALTIGGRNPVIMTIKNYLLGMGLCLPFIVNEAIKRKLIVLVVSSIVFFSLFSTLVANERSIVNEINVKEYDSSVASSFSGIMEYMSAHYWGYQLRRTDFSKGDNLRYGVATFYGLGNISVPFSASLGLNGNLWDLVGIDYDPLETYKSGEVGFYTTSTIYALLVRDFGVEGTYIAIIIIVFITQMIFINLFKRRTLSILSLLPIVIVFSYWASSNFNSGFAYLQQMLISALIFDLAQNNYRKKC